ncbi:MAG: hypothetical protein WAU01_15525, partial [Saprospiraceae bacterium]
ANCHDFTVTSNRNPSLDLSPLYCYGDFRLHTPINFISSLEMCGNQANQIIYTNSNLMSRINIVCEGTVRLTSDLNIRIDYFDIIKGTFKTDNYAINSEGYISMYDQIFKPIADFGKSTITIGGSSFPYRQPFWSDRSGTILGDSSTIVLKALTTGLEIQNGNSKLGHVITDHINGIGQIYTYGNNSARKISMFGNGSFESNIPFIYTGSLTVDSLLLSAGKTYTFQQKDTIFINKYLKAKGNNCLAISLLSSVSGSKTTFSMPANAILETGFIQIRDNAGIGRPSFDAGPFSSNVNNSNLNWLFPTPNPLTDRGFLGPDRFLCTSSPNIILDAFNSTTSEKYLWSNNSTASKLTVTQPGSYHVTVTFGNSCIIKDTVIIYSAAVIDNILPRDTVFCSAQDYIIRANVNNPSASFLWNNSSTTQNITINSAGKYFVNVNLDGCDFSDTIKIDYILLQNINLGKDTVGCVGDTINLSVNVLGANITWQDGIKLSKRPATTSGIYWVEVNQASCKVRDSINIGFNPLPVFNLGRDTSICEGD